ncbi:MAG TPA: DUF4388 domain-containing protein, partial [Pyrinomonadaceae bacterium]
MGRTLRDREILHGIRDLSSNRATGKLQITTGMTQGAIFFNKGQIVDANLGKLNGFQAINVIASIPDATFDFDPSISPPVQHFNFRERLVLTKAFGLNVQSEPEYSPGVDEPLDDVPATAIPLNDVEEEPSSGVVQVETGPVLDLSSVDPAAVISDTTPLNTDEQLAETYYSNDEDVLPDSAPSKWSVLKNFFRRKVHSKPEYLSGLNEPLDDAPATAILLNGVPSSSVVQVETQPVHELSALEPLNNDAEPHESYYSTDDDIIPDSAPSKWSVLKNFFSRKVQREPEYLPAVNEPSDAAPAKAILLNDIEEQLITRVVQVETEPVLELSSVAFAVTSTDEQPHETDYSNDEDILPDNAPSKWSVLKAFLGRKVHSEPEYLPAVNEPSDAAPA